MVEGTVAGLAAGIVAGGLWNQVCRRAPKLELLRDGQVIDLSLIDLLVTDYAFTGVRAVWEADAIREIFLTRARPSAIGFSSVGGYVRPLPMDSGQGLHLTLGSGQGRVRVPIAPTQDPRDRCPSLPIESSGPGREFADLTSRATIALDGEREITQPARTKVVGTALILTARWSSISTGPLRRLLSTVCFMKTFNRIFLS